MDVCLCPLHLCSSQVDCVDLLCVIALWSAESAIWLPCTAASHGWPAHHLCLAPQQSSEYKHCSTHSTPQLTHRHPSHRERTPQLVKALGLPTSPSAGPRGRASLAEVLYSWLPAAASGTVAEVFRAFWCQVYPMGAIDVCACAYAST